MSLPRPDIPDLLDVAVPSGGKVITVSDLHLPPVRTEVSGRSCRTLARRLTAEPGPLTVVLAGDVVELLGFPEATATEILRAHDDLCAALLAVAAGGGQVVYTIGNHDGDIAWDVKAADAVREMTGARLCLAADLILADGRKVRVEHGWTPRSATTSSGRSSRASSGSAAAGSTARTRWRIRPTSRRSSPPGSSTASWPGTCGG
jgi:UDP-2,3-diacylglucosamine pyrophosphatase LpxH